VCVVLACDLARWVAALGPNPRALFASTYRGVFVGDLPAFFRLTGWVTCGVSLVGAALLKDGSGGAGARARAGAGAGAGGGADDDDEVLSSPRKDAEVGAGAGASAGPGAGNRGRVGFSLSAERSEATMVEGEESDEEKRLIGSSTQDRSIFYGDDGPVGRGGSAAVLNLEMGAVSPTTEVTGETTSAMAGVESIAQAGHTSSAAAGGRRGDAASAAVDVTGGGGCADLTANFTALFSRPLFWVVYLHLVLTMGSALLWVTQAGSFTAAAVGTKDRLSTMVVLFSLAGAHAMHHTSHSCPPLSTLSAHCMPLAARHVTLVTPHACLALNPVDAGLVYERPDNDNMCGWVSSGPASRATWAGGWRQGRRRTGWRPGSGSRGLCSSSSAPYSWGCRWRYYPCRREVTRARRRGQWGRWTPAPVGQHPGIPRGKNARAGADAGAPKRWIRLKQHDVLVASKLRVQGVGCRVGI